RCSLRRSPTMRRAIWPPAMRTAGRNIYRGNHSISASTTSCPAITRPVPRSVRRHSSCTPAGFRAPITTMMGTAERRREPQWRAVGRIKGPVLRALAARAPYFHNGFAKDLDAVVDFYNDRFELGLTDREHDDLVAFLLAL